MEKSDFLKLKIPETAGVYYFLSPAKRILYIGKATSLRSRLKSYFSPDLSSQRSVLIAKMVREAMTIDWTTTESVLEALILETNLIRTHKPKFNTRSKDDKTYNHLIITKEEWPRVLVVRGKDLTELYPPAAIKHHFGPFPSGLLLKDALRIIQKIFRYYDTKKPIGSERSKIVRGKIDFNRQLGLYPNTVDKNAYRRTIRHLALFFSGKKQAVIEDLKRAMLKAAKAERFEEAGQIKRQIFSLQHIEDIALIKHERAQFADRESFRIEAYDVAHFLGAAMVGALVVIENGEPKKSEYRKFKINTVTIANDPAALREMLQRRVEHSEWASPQLVVVDGNEVQKRQAELVLHQAGYLVPVVAVQKNRQHKPERLIGEPEIIARYELQILFANAEAHRFSNLFHRHTQRKKSLQ